MGVCYSQKIQQEERNMEALVSVKKEYLGKMQSVQDIVQISNEKLEVHANPDFSIDLHDFVYQIQNSSRNILLEHSDASLTSDIHFSSQQYVKTNKQSQFRSILKKNIENKSPKHVQFFFRKFDSRCTNFDIGNSSNRVPYEEQYHPSDEHQSNDVE